jgi:hypothetical protein
LDASKARVVGTFRQSKETRSNLAAIDHDQSDSESVAVAKGVEAEGPGGTEDDQPGQAVGRLMESSLSAMSSDPVGDDKVPSIDTDRKTHTIDDTHRT